MNIHSSAEKGTSQKARRINDAADALGICKSTIYKLERQKKLRLVRILGRTLVPESEIERLASKGASEVDAV